MEIEFGPNSVDDPDLLYKLQRKIKVFNTNDPLPNRGYNLVASSSKYALVFVAVPDGVLTVYHLNQLVTADVEPQHLTVQLQEKPTHIAVSCDFELLAVTGGQLLSVYKVADFQNSNIAPSITLKTEVSLSTFVVALQWNPCIPDSIAIAFYDGTLYAAQLQTGQTKKVPSKARCICWSPKGKQIVTGNSDGTLMQFKPDLTPAKTVPAPNLFEGNPVEAMAIYWISTFQFAVVFKNVADNNSRPALTIINTPKAGPPKCLNYEDICYSMFSNRPWYYFLQGLAQWNMILSSSSNSMEIGTLGSADGANWQQWCQTDEARPELPLTDKKQENYPVGISIDTCAIHQLPWGENETLPHMPLLHVVSQSGLLTTFNIINLKKGAQQICSPPVLVSLPAHVMTSKIPGEVQAEQAPPPPQPVPVPKQEPQISMIQQVLQAPSQASQFGSAPIKVPSYQPQANVAYTAAPPQIPEQKTIEIKPVPIPQPTQQPPPLVPITPQPQAPAVPLTPQLTPQQIKENEANKAEQERKNKIKANQELKNMLVKEVNDFQMELYNFMVKTRETQVRLQRDIQTYANNTAPSVDAEQLKKECSMEELRGAIVQLKLELVRACAVVAEARTHSDVKELHQWTQADPLTTKRVASVKKLAYYVQTQLEQAHKALDYKWNEIAAAKDPQYHRPGKRMIRPILDDVYQPLVKQQEILCRQQAVLRTLKNTLKECDVGPVFKSTSLLRSTPFRNKDPLSKLTKNILNMSIEPETKPKQSLLTPQKLDALRDVFSNHKTIKIKPVNVELRQHLATMRHNYEKSLKEKAQAPVVKAEEAKPQSCQCSTQQVQIKSEPNPAIQQPTALQQATAIQQKALQQATAIQHRAALQQATATQQKALQQSTAIQHKAALQQAAAIQQMAMQQQTAMQQKGVMQQTVSAPAFTPVTKPTFPSKSPLNVARTLFTDDPEPPKQPQAQVPKPFSFSGPTIPVTVDAKTVLKDLLTNKQANLEKNNANTFMGQKICSPTAFAQPPTSTPTSAPPAFTSKPIADINNMFNKFQTQPLTAETKSVQKPIDVKSSETGEPEETITPKPFEVKKEKVPVANVFGIKPQPIAASTPNVPDVLKTSVQEITKTAEKAKENVTEKANENVPTVVLKLPEKKEAVKPVAPTTNKSFVFGAPQATATESVTTSIDLKPLDLKAEKVEPKVEESSDANAKSEAASIFASANVSAVTKPQSSVLPSPATSAPPTKDESVTPKSEPEAKPDLTASPETASSVFSAAVAAQPTTSSIFSAPTSSIFSSTSQNSVFGTTTTQSGSVFGAKPSIFSGSTAFGTATPASTTTQSAFTSTAASVFASATPAFGTTTTASSVFGATTATTTASVFGSTTPTFGTTTASVFGSNPPSPSSVFAQATPSNTSVFGATPTTQSPVFGATTTASAFSPTTTSIFGAATTAASIFATASTQASSVFGQASQSVFGGQGAQPSIFGGTTQASVFGATQAFGSPTQTTQATAFGTPTQSTQSSIFGTPTAAPQASVFGSPSQGNQASVFGSPATTQASIFGSAPTTTAQGSLFGGGEANLFASATISTTSAPTQGSGGNIFGGSQSGSVFGSNNTNVFGGGTTFGQSNQSATSIFGGGASFGQKPATDIWGSGGNTTGGFGSTGFGQATTQSSSIFGGSTGGSFSAPSAGAFGSPQQGSAFGSPQQQQSPGFGGSPGFGSKPVFGQTTGFGSPTSAGFGGPAAFGGFNKSPGGGFGAPAAFGGGSAFGGGGNTSPGGFAAAAAQSNSTFETLATQNTLTFGNLAQQSPHQQAAPSFNTSPSFTGWRG